MRIDVHRLWPRRPRDGSLPLGLSCDSEGLLLAGNCRLIAAALTPDGQVFFRARPAPEINAVLSAGYGTAVDISDGYPRIERLAGYMSRGEWFRAALAALNLRFPELPDQAAARRILEADRLLKLAWNSDLHPRWPAHSEEGRGGRFAPAGDTSEEPNDAERQRQLAQRRRDRQLFQILRKLIRLIPKYGKLVDDLIRVIRIIQVLKALKEISPELQRSIEPPKNLEELRAEKEFRAFPTADAFARYYGSAGAGYEWHHIVERGADFPAEQLHNTDNVIRVPKFIHEEVTAIYNKPISEGSSIRIRDAIQEFSYSEQREIGLAILRNLGAVK